MAGEISPDTMFCKESIKTCMEHSSRVSMGLMGEVGCIGRGGKQKQEQKEEKQTSRTCFSIHVTGQKNQKVDKDGDGGLERIKGRNKWETMGALYDMNA